jgi:glycosyltransferase involved in cell wall biosynthesis
MANLRKPRLMYMITRAEHGGAQSHLLDLLNAFRKDFELSVAIGEEGFLTQACRAQSVRVHVIPHLRRDVKPWSDTKALFSIFSLIGREQPDLIHTHTWKAGLLGRLAARLRGIPCIYTVHMWHFGPQTPRIWRIFGPGMERAAARWSERTITVSQWGADIGSRFRIAEPSRVVVIRTGIADTPERARLDPTASSLVVMVARFSSFKDHEVLVRAFAQVEPSARLLLVGDGPTRLATEQLVAALGIGHRVEFAGDRNDVAKLLSQADIFVLATKFDHFPVSILEAMRAGLPVIASKVGGIPELVAHGDTGLLVEPQSILEMTSALGRLIDSKSLRASMGRAGRIRYETYFSLRQMIDRTRMVYADTLRESHIRETDVAHAPAFQSDRRMSSSKP